MIRSDPACPPSPARRDDDTAERALVSLLAERRTVVLSGAGCSTESGIPDYRGPGTRRRARNPVQYREFVHDEAARRRYWARSVLGWPRFAAAHPNGAHRALAELEAGGVIAGVITQNVDRLHQRAGSHRVIELHGALAEVRCLDCGDICDRAALQQRLLALNPDWARDIGFDLAPDGDADPTGARRFETFRVSPCQRCRGVLKPHVVFFGESVPRATVDRAWALFEEAEALLVVGSSLAVYSGFRFARRAARERRPLALLNLGPTRADALADRKLIARAGEALPRIARALLGG